MKPSPKRALIIHSDPKQAEQIKKALESGAFFRAECIFSGTDSLPFFESALPDLVLLEASLNDVPSELLVAAFRKMSPRFRLWLCTAQNPARLQNLAGRLQALGVLRPPLTGEDTARLANRPRQGKETPSAWNEDETITDQEATIRGLQTVLSARELNRKGVYRHQGAVKVVGDLEGVQRLEVMGPLTVEGNVIRSNIRCDGHLKVLGEIRGCRRLGVFCRSFIEVGSIAESIVVCGKSLFLETCCAHSQLNVVHRLIGKTVACAIVGGLTRVGEHLDIGVIGDAKHTETHVELAPELLRKSWVHSKRGLWKIAVSLNPELAHRRTSQFRAQLRDPLFYQRHAGLVARRIHAGLTIKIGEHEDNISKSSHGPVRILLGPKNGEQLGILIQRDQTRLPGKTREQRKK